MGSYREEKDFLGVVGVPAKALYGIFTKRALDNFMISGLRIDWEFIKTLAQIKKAAALANNELDLLDDELCKAIGRAARAQDSVPQGRSWWQW